MSARRCGHDGAPSAQPRYFSGLTRATVLTHPSGTSQVRRAAEMFEVELDVVQIDAALRDEIGNAQDRHKMVNVPLDEVADDLTFDESHR